MGCVSSSFLEEEEGAGGGSGFRHHIVFLTSTTYGLLTTLDQPTPTTLPLHPQLGPPKPPPPPPPLPPPFVYSALRRRSEQEVINSWELMEGLDHITTPPTKSPLLDTRQSLNPKHFLFCTGKENSVESNWFPISDPCRNSNVLSPSNVGKVPPPKDIVYSLEMFDNRCPPGGENSVVIYTTTLRGIRKTFEDCNAIRSLLEGMGVWVKERDVSMDLGFREELKGLMKGSVDGCTVPRVFVRGRYIGGAEQVQRIHEEGGLGRLLEGLPRVPVGEPCDGCGGARFLPCFRCCGGRKVVVMVVVEGRERGLVVRCPECNENGLVLCPICC